MAWVMASRGMERKEEKRRGGERGEREGVRGRVATLFHLGHFPEYDQHTQGSHGDRMVGGRRVRGSPSRRGGEGTGGGASPGFEQAFFLTPSSAARRSPPMLTVPAGAAAADREPRTARAAMRRVERRDAIVAVACVRQCAWPPHTLHPPRLANKNRGAALFFSCAPSPPATALPHEEGGLVMREACMHM